MIYEITFNNGKIITITTIGNNIDPIQEIIKSPAENLLLPENIESIKEL